MIERVLRLSAWPTTARRARIEALHSCGAVMIYGSLRLSSSHLRSPSIAKADQAAADQNPALDR